MPSVVQPSPIPGTPNPLELPPILGSLVDRLENDLQGRLGFAAVANGRCIGANAQEQFPMASTYKVPLAGLLLTMVDNQLLELQQMVAITERHVEETGPIAQSVVHPGVMLSLANLVELMLVQSNNNATDRVFDLVGGPTAVMSWLNSLEIAGMSVDRHVNDLLNDFWGFPVGSASMKAFHSRWINEDDRARASYLPNPLFEDGPKDATTPVAMVKLLGKLFEGNVLSPSSRAFLRGAMERCETGNGRIRALLPPGTSVASKTGSVGGSVNDVAWITLPEGRGPLALAIFTKKSTLLPFTTREPVVAQLARGVFDWYCGQKNAP
jgi:beta-lactamase class A